MKKIISIFIVVLFLALSFSACQPTPDHDIIINKAEQTIPPAPTKAPQVSAEPDASSPSVSELPVYELDLPGGDARVSREGVPEHVELTDNTFGNLTLIIDADVVANPEAEYPVIEVGIRDISHEPAFSEKLFSLLCPGCTVYEDWERTKEEVGIQMQATMDYDGGSNGILELDKEGAIACLLEELISAPDEPQKVAYDHSEGFSEQMYYLEEPDGSVRLMNVREKNELIYVNSVHMLFYSGKYLIPGDDPIDDPLITEEDALSKAEEFLEAMGFNELCLLKTELEFGFDTWSFERSETLWTLTYTRTIGGACSVDPDTLYGNSVATVENLSSSVGSPWQGIEMVRMHIGSEGIYSAHFSGACEITRTHSEDVPFLDFSSAFEIIEKQFCYQFSERARTVTICEISLVYGLTCIKDVYDYGVYIPMWQVKFKTTDFPGTYLYKYFSAIDGSTQEPRVSRRILMEWAGK